MRRVSRPSASTAVGSSLSSCYGTIVAAGLTAPPPLLVARRQISSSGRVINSSSNNGGSSSTRNSSSASSSSSSSSTTPTNTTTTTPLAIKCRDTVVKSITKCGQYRVTAATTSHLLQDTINRHNLHDCDAPFLDLLGTTITLANLMASLLQGEERVEVRHTTKFGAQCIAESLSLGECRAYVAMDDDDDDDDSNTVKKSSSPFLLDNTLSVRRTLYRNADPVLSATAATFEQMYGRTADEQQRQLAPSLVMLNNNNNNINKSNNNSNNKGEEGGGDNDLPEGVDPRLLPAALQRCRQRFDLNLTPHAAHFFKQSEGIPSAILLSSSVQPVTVEEGPSSAKQQQQAKVLHSSGVLIQSLALPEDDHSHNDNKNNNGHNSSSTSQHYSLIDRTQHMFTGVALCPVPPTVASIVGAALETRGSANSSTTSTSNASSSSTLLQDLLSLATGDYEGATHVAKAARLNTDDVDTLRAQYEPLRDRFGLWSGNSSSDNSSSSNSNSYSSTSSSSSSSSSDLDGQRLVLDTESMERTPLDFFCRCSKTGGLLDSLQAMPLTKRRELVGHVSRCAYCCREYPLTAEDLQV